MIPVVFLTSVLATYIGAETYSLAVERLIIKDQQLPKAFHNLRVVFISDLHHGIFSSSKRLRSMVKKINDLQPDLILLGGDYLQTYKNKKSKQTASLHELRDILSKLQQPEFGIFSVSGNHDHVYNVEVIKTELAKANIANLDNQGLELKKDKEKIFLAGVGDLWFDKPDLAAALQQRKTKNEFTLLLSHQPNFIDQIEKKDGINFVLAGHTHGSQFRLFGYQPFAPKKNMAKWEYMAGLIDTPQTRMLVSPGIGTVTPYFRFFAPPKIHLLVFKSAPRLSI